MSEQRNFDGLATKGGPAPLDGAKLAEAINGLTERIGTLEETHQKTLAAGDLGAELGGIKSAVDALAENAKRFEQGADWSEPFDAIKERLDAIEAAGQRAPMPVGAKSLGQEIYDSAEFKTYMDSTGKLNIPRGQFGNPIAVPDFSAKQLTTDDLDIRPVDYRPGVISPIQDVMNLASRIMRQPVQGALTWVVRRETQASLDGYVSTTLAADIDGDPTPKTTATFTDVNGFVAGTYVSFWNATHELLKRVAIVSINTTTNVVTFATDALDFDATTGWRVTSNNFGAVAEGSPKHYGYAEVETITSALKTLPTMLALTEQVLSSVPGLNAWIENKLRNRSRRNLSWHLMYGDGTADDQLAGWDNETAAQTYSWSSGEVGDNRFDAIFKACALLPYAGSIVVVMNKIDQLYMTLSKGDDDHYITNSVFSDLRMQITGGRTFVGPYEIIVDDACAEGDFFAVNMAEASELVDAMTNTLRWGYVGDQFAENEITARYEQRLLHAINVPQAIVLGEFDNAPT